MLLCYCSKIKAVRSGIRTHAYMSRLRPERSALDRWAILTTCITHLFPNSPRSSGLWCDCSQFSGGEDCNHKEQLEPTHPFHFQGLTIQFACVCIYKSTKIVSNNRCFLYMTACWVRSEESTVPFIFILLLLLFLSSRPPSSVLHQSPLHRSS